VSEAPIRATLRGDRKARLVAAVLALPTAAGSVGAINGQCPKASFPALVTA